MVFETREAASQHGRPLSYEIWEIVGENGRTAFTALVDPCSIKFAWTGVSISD